MTDEKLSITTSDGTEITVIKAPARCGVSFVIPRLLIWQESQAVTDVMAERQLQGVITLDPNDPECYGTVSLPLDPQ
jgi:hypothetical protein